ncbi:MAG: hypothetical protein ACREMZ_12875 [Gemmatimonadales bacterium]
MTDSPTFAAAFYPGQVLTDHSALSEFHRFLPPTDGKTVSEYAQQLAEKGLALVMSSEQIRDIGLYKQQLAAARQARLPLVITTNPRPDEWQDSDRENYTPERRTQLIAEARLAADRAAVMNTPRG